MKQLFSIVLSLVLLVLSVYSQGTFLPTSIVNGTWVNGSVTAFNSPGALATNALVFYYKMNEASGSLVDSSTNYLTGYPTGSISYTQLGVVGTAIQGSRSVTTYVTNLYSGMASNSNWTISFWMKIGASANIEVPIAARVYSGGNANGWVIANSSGNIGGNGMWFVSGTNGTYGTLPFTTSAFFDNTWKHVACVWSNDIVFAYTNGVLAAASSSFATVKTTSVPIYPMLMNDGFAVGTTYGWSGYLDEVGYWATNLTPAQIQYLAATNPFSKF